MEKGRSMVEMLGVLAIIGVLSAAGLAGYSKAMFKYKMTQTIETFSLVLQRCSELAEKNIGDNFSIRSSDDIVKYGLLPSCQKADEYSCRLPMGRLIIDGDRGIYTVNGINTSANAINVSVNFTSANECIAFSSIGWENSIIAKNVELNISGEDDYYFTKTEMKNVAMVCKSECKDGDCSFTISFLL